MPNKNFLECLKTNKYIYAIRDLRIGQLFKNRIHLWVSNFSCALFIAGFFFNSNRFQEKKKQSLKPFSILDPRLSL